MTNPGHDKPCTDKPWTRQILDTTNTGHDKPWTRQTLDTTNPAQNGVFNEIYAKNTFPCKFFVQIIGIFSGFYAFF
jgi:hypothetical protein